MRELSYVLKSKTSDQIEIFSSKRPMIVFRFIYSVLLIFGPCLLLYFAIKDGVFEPIILFFFLMPTIFSAWVLWNGRRKTELIVLNNEFLSVTYTVGNNMTQSKYIINEVSDFSIVFDPRRDLPHFEMRRTLLNTPRGRIAFICNGEKVEFANLIEYEDAPYLLKEIKTFYGI